MENMISVENYFNGILFLIKEEDPLHYNTILEDLKKTQCILFEEVKSIIINYFIKENIECKKVVTDYLWMVFVMRVETVKFLHAGKYSCKDEQEAYNKFYSNAALMNSYMNALLLSQILWRHHFNMLYYFNSKIESFKNIKDFRVLDVGSGHGLFSWIIKYRIPFFKRIDILDISKSSLAVVKSMLGEDKINYINYDLSYININFKYELVMLGELLEHVDNPTKVLKKAKSLLSPSGGIWLTVPTNAPALDHIYLFRNASEIIDIVKLCNLKIVDVVDFKANSLTSLVGIYCK